MAQPPAFQFYARDWLAGNARPMTLEQKGAFIDLLAYAWLEQGIPDDPGQIARILGISKREFHRIWPAIEPSWTPHEESRTLRNARLERYRLELQEHSAERSESGRKGAAARWGNPEGHG